MSWRPLLLSFQALKQHDYYKVGNGKLILSPENLRYRYKISDGVNFGDVEFGMSADGCPLAVKRTSLYSWICNSSLRTLLKETVTPLIGLQNEHILQYVHCILEKNQIFLSTPLCEYNLGQYIMYLKHCSQLNLKATNLVRQVNKVFY